MTPDLKENYKILVTLIAISLLVLLCSCGSRKVQKSDVKEETKTEQSTTKANDIESKTETNTVINDESNDVEITPIDTSKAIIINGKTYKNAKVKFLNRKSQTAITKKETVRDLSKQETKAIIAVKKQEVKRDIERKSNPLLPLLWLLIPAIGYLIWKYKYKLIGL